MTLSPRIIYSPRYNIGVFGLERLHPFDSRKYGRAWKELRRRLGRELDRFWMKPPRAVSEKELLQVHSVDYLQQLRNPRFVAKVLEVAPLRYLLGPVADYCVLRPMRWATMGTIIATQAAMEHGLAINLSGGYHHASPQYGHGFSAYADVALAIHEMRRTGKLQENDKVAYVDLDAHQGNGVCHSFFDDRRVMIYDQYNRQNFPWDISAQQRIDCDVPMHHGCQGVEYLAALKKRLPTFLDSITRGGAIKLAVYNAGTDIYVNDQLGGFNVSAAQVLERDKFVIEQLGGRGIPTAVVLSGGYSRESYMLVVEMVAHAMNLPSGIR